MSRPFAQILRGRFLARNPLRLPYGPRVTRRFASNAESGAKMQARMDRIISRMPKFLQGYMQPLVRAPASHIVSFLVLHEISAIVPLAGLGWAFHQFDWLPPYISETKWAKEGIDTFVKMMRKYSRIDEKPEGDAAGARQTKILVPSKEFVKWMIEMGTAWAIVKFLLPVRIIWSVWAAPWFARKFILPYVNGFRAVLGMKAISTTRSSASATAAVAKNRPAAGTHAVGNRVTGKR